MHFRSFYAQQIDRKMIVGNSRLSFQKPLLRVCILAGKTKKALWT